MPRGRTPCTSLTREGGCSWPQASQLLSDGWSTKSPQACTKSIKVKGSLKSEGSPPWFESLGGHFCLDVQRFPLTPGGYFSEAVERPFRVFWELLFFSNESCSFTCLSFRQQPPGKCHRQQHRICREQQGQELSQENAPSFCSLIFHSVLVSQRFVWSSVGKCAFWKRYSSTNLLEGNIQGEEQNSHLRGLQWNIVWQDSGEETGIFLSMKGGASCGRKKKLV